MKRFFETATVFEVDQKHSVALDGKPIRTPEGSAVVLPTATLAAEVAAEWSAQGDEIKPLTMPLTRLACTAIDKVIPVRPRVIEQIARYGQSDLLCYRSQGPDDLVAHQAANWQPILDWLEAHHQVPLAVTHGIVHVEQPESSLRRLTEIVGGYEGFRLTGLAELTQLTGSLAVAIAFVDGQIAAEEVVVVSQLDDDWQADKWGEDGEALARRKHLEADILAAVRFLDALAEPAINRPLDQSPVGR
ncbi:MAG: ATPase [Rhodospirillales bacterium]|nr:ATPase [Rhodospirillales bacterium]